MAKKAALVMTLFASQKRGAVPMTLACSPKKPKSVARATALTTRFVHSQASVFTVSVTCYLI
jgi:hypothetical protein